MIKCRTTKVYSCFSFVQLSEEVVKKRNDYYRYLEDYKLLRSRFEKQYFECEYVEVDYFMRTYTYLYIIPIRIITE